MQLHINNYGVPFERIRHTIDRVGDNGKAYYETDNEFEERLNRLDSQEKKRRAGKDSHRGNVNILLRVQDS